MLGYTIIRKSELAILKKQANRYYRFHTFIWWLSCFPLDELRKYILDETYYGDESSCRAKIAADLNKFYGVEKLDSMGREI